MIGVTRFLLGISQGHSLTAGHISRESGARDADKDRAWERASGK